MSISILWNTLKDTENVYLPGKAMLQPRFDFHASN